MNPILIFILAIISVHHASGGVSATAAAGSYSSQAIDINAIETQFREFAPVSKIGKIINETNQAPLHAWISGRQLTATNQQTLMFLALGIDHQTGIQSGSVSVKAIDLIRAVLQPGTIKTTLDWMSDMLTDPVGGYEKWKMNSDPLQIYKEFPLLGLSVLSYVESKHESLKKEAKIRFTKIKNELAKIINAAQERLKTDISSGNCSGDFCDRFRIYANTNFELHNLLGQDLKNHLYQMSVLVLGRLGWPIALCNSGSLIKGGYITKDLKGNQIASKCEAAADYYRLAIQKGQVLEAYVNLGILIKNGHIKANLNGDPIQTDKQRYEAAAECYRLAIQKGQVPEAYVNLGILINDGHIKTNLNGDPIQTEKQRYEAAAKYYRLAIEKRQVPKAYVNLGVLINDGHIKTNLNGDPIQTEKERYEAAAECYRLAIQKGQVPEAYSNLGVLINDGHIKTNLEGGPITTENQYEEAAKYYRLAIEKGQLPEAYSNLGALIENGYVITNESGAEVNDKLLTAHRLFELASSKYPQEFAKLYIRHDFGLTPGQRIEKIKSILKGAYPEVLIFAKRILTPLDQTLVEQLKEMLETVGGGIESLDFVPENDTDLSAEAAAESLLTEEKEVREKLAQDHETFLLEQANRFYDLGRAIANIEREEATAQRLLFNDEEACFMKIKRLFLAGEGKIQGKIEEKQKCIRQFIQPTIASSSSKKIIVNFTKAAYEQYQALNQTGRARVKALLQAIENKDRTGNEEALKGKDNIINGRRVMTRELGKDDRMAYIQDGSVVTILRLEGHFNPRGLGLTSDQPYITMSAAAEASAS